MLSAARFPLRTAGFVGLTLSLYAALEADTALSPDAERAVVLSRWIARYGRGLLRLYGVRVLACIPMLNAIGTYPGTDARGRGRIFVMNHRSGLDVPITLSHFDATIVSRADLARWPVIGMAARRVGTLFVDRASRRSGAEVTQRMIESIERGRAIMVYPEGTTYAGDEVRNFRVGAFTVAERTGAEVVPVGLAYGGDSSAFVDESFPEHMKRISRAPATVAALVAGEPMASTLRAEALRAAARERVQALVHEARALVGGEGEATPLTCSAASRQV
jgi:1-acyl-sn-glycerol-3-phosphate acyltransferase